jgi:ATP-dependent protease Clp ATPase subunit
MSDAPSKEALNCTFCRKSQNEVVALLAFPDDLSICDECVSLMVDIIATDHRDWRDKQIERLKSLPASGA